ncbi:MAG: hypothetical protein ISS55_01105 [Dehalococcoidales bacterium]|nr:hypothetical protein [Dehalococcoidales bacterium]
MSRGFLVRYISDTPVQPMLVATQEENFPSRHSSIEAPETTLPGAWIDALRSFWKRYNPGTCAIIHVTVICI